MSDRFTNADLADAERRASLGEALAGRSFALRVREVSPAHRTGWGMAAEFPDGVMFDFDHLADGAAPVAGAALGQAQVEAREVDGRWRFVVTALEPAPAAPVDEPAEGAAPVASGAEDAASEPEPAAPAPAETSAAETTARPVTPIRPEKPQAPRIVRGDELLRRVLQLLVRRARDGRRAPSPKLKTAVADGRTLGVDLAILERWLPSAEQALQLEGRARHWLDAALAKRPSPERADARESLQCLLETFDRAGQPLANLARRAFADRERRPEPPLAPRHPRHPRRGRASEAAPSVEAEPGAQVEAAPERGPEPEAEQLPIEAGEAPPASSEPAPAAGD
jgi:hypothetical protein